MKEVMIDLETLATSERAIVTEIGAIKFDRKTGRRGDKYHTKINTANYQAILPGAEIDASTVMWWLSQPKAAQDKLIIQPGEQSKDVFHAFSGLNDFLVGTEKVWCHPSFDFKILEWHLKSLKLKPNFKFTAARDLRTMADEAQYNYYKHPFKGVKHTALDDCDFQIDYLLECFRMF